MPLVPPPFALGPHRRGEDLNRVSRVEVRKLGGRETRTPSEMTSFSRPRFLGLCCLVVLKEDKLLKVCELEHAHRQTYQHVLCRKPQ